MALLIHDLLWLFIRRRKALEVQEINVVEAEDERCLSNDIGDMSKSFLLFVEPILVIFQANTAASSSPFPACLS